MSAYIDLPDIRRWIGLGGDVVNDDAILTDLIEVASGEVDNHCHRTFSAPGEATARVYPGGQPFAFIDDTAAASITLVEQSRDRQTWTPVATWWTEPDNDTIATQIAANTRFAPWVRVTAPYGYPGGPPPEVRQATRLRVAALLARKDSPLGIAGGDSFGIARVSRFDDPDLVRLLDNLVRHDREGLA